jgi:ABC-type uncharacterized transport system substrate-binding protein
LHLRLGELRKRNIDGIWVLPSASAITPEMVDSYFDFARENGLPIIGFSASFLRRGALAVIEMTPRDVGSQVCQMISKTRTGTSSGITDLSTGKISFNSAVAEKIGIRVPIQFTPAP